MTCLFDEELACPIPVIILSILKSLAPILQPTNCRANTVALVQTPSWTFFLYCMLAIKDPCFALRVICLSCTLVVGHKHKNSFNIIIDDFISQLLNIFG